MAFLPSEKIRYRKIRRTGKPRVRTFRLDGVEHFDYGGNPLMSEKRSVYFEDADISFTAIWSEERKEYRPVEGSYFDHCEMSPVPDGIGEDLIKSFSFPKNFSTFLVDILQAVCNTLIKEPHTP